MDTSRRIDISGGRLYQSNILSIVKGQNGVPGEMVGNIDYKHGQILGQIESNNENGIFGTLAEDAGFYDESQAFLWDIDMRWKKVPRLYGAVSREISEITKWKLKA